MKIVRSPSRFLCEVCSSSRSTNQLIYPFYCFKGSFDRFEFNFQNFRGCVSLFSYQGPFRFRNSLFLPQQQLVHSIITFCACQELFSKVFRFLFSSDRSFLIFFGAPGTETCHFPASRLQRTFISYHSTSSLSKTFLTFFQSFLNFGWTFKGHQIPAAILYLLSVWRPPQRQLCYDIIASSICQLYF